MVSVYMNPENLERKIADLKAFAESVKEHNDTVNKMYNNEPIEIGGDYLKPIHVAIDSAADEIKAHADKLTDCKTTMVNLNSNGVASHDLEGGISIEVPDDSAGLENTDKFQKWAQGATDANDLKYMKAHQGDKFPSEKLPSGRTCSEVVESLKAEKGDPTYANAFIDSVGAEKLVDLPSSVGFALYGKTESRQEEERTFSRALGGLLATASQTWDKDKSESMSKKIVASVTPEDGARNKWFGLRYLNEMFRGTDADNNHVNDLVFGKDFLVSMGDGLEKLPWEDIRKCYSHPYGYESQDTTLLGYRTTEWSYDPLSGVLDAMGNNPEAAVQFLAPYDHDRSTYDDGGPKADTSRLDRLLKRDWEPDGYSGLTGAIAAASSMRASDSAAVRESANQIAGRSLHFLAENSTTSSVGKEDLYSMPGTKTRVGMLLANCAPEITQAWSGGSLTELESMNSLPLASKEDINRLTSRVSDDAHATSTISSGIAEYSRSCSQSGVKAKEGDPDAQVAAINNAYKRGSKAVNYLAGIADARAGEINEKSKDNFNAKSASATAAVNVFFDVAKTGAENVGGPVTKVMGHVATKMVTPAIKTYVTPVIVKSIVGEPDPKVFSPVKNEEADSNLRAAAIRDASEADLFNQSDFEGTPEKEKAASKITVKDGGKYRIDLSKAKAENVKDWVDKAVLDQPRLKALQDDIAGESATARNYGYDAGEDVKKNPR